MQWLAGAVHSLKERSRTLTELAGSLKYYILDYVEIEPKAKEKFLKPENIKILSGLNELLEGLEEFTASGIEKVFLSMSEKHSMKLGSIAQPVRVALTGGTASPGIFEVMEIIGKEKVLKRLLRVINGG